MKTLLRKLKKETEKRGVELSEKDLERYAVLIYDEVLANKSIRRVAQWHDLPISLVKEIYKSKGGKCANHSMKSWGDKVSQ